MIKIKMDNFWTYFAYFMILFGTVGGILLAIIQAKGAENDNKKQLTAHQNTINFLKNTTNSLKEDLKNRDEKINSQQEEIKQLYKILSGKSDFIEKYISGGKSFPYVKIEEIQNINNQPTKYLFNLHNDYEFPIYDIHVKIMDYDLFKEKSFLIFGAGENKFIKVRDFDACTLSTTDINLMYPKSVKSPLVAGHSREYNLYIKIHTRNKMLHQKLTVYIHEKRAYIGSEVHDPIEKKMIQSDYNTTAPVEVQKELRKRLKAIPANLEYTLLE